MQMHEPVLYKNHQFRIAHDLDVPNIRVLVNSAYKELGDLGLNYTGTYQDEQTTRERMSAGRSYLLEKEGQLIGTVLLHKENHFTRKNSAYVSQLAVTPSLKNRGYGSLFMDLCEDLARKEGYQSIQLDTAKPAKRLVDWYVKRGYRIVGAVRWAGKTYDSWIFEKNLVTNS